MQDQSDSVPQPSTTDIIFECPECGKSLAIDSKGAGLMISCPSCRERVQVPASPAIEDPGSSESDPKDRRIQDLTTSLETSHAKIERLVESLEETKSRRKYLEKMRVENMDRFDAISRDLASIQSALDRIVATIQQVDMNRNGNEENE